MSQIVSRLTERGVRHQSMAATLELQSVSVAYQEGSNKVAIGRNRPLALDNISFAVEKGERVAVVGPNGAGKSTLFKLIVGTIQPTRGQVTIYGHGPGGHICIGYVPQRNQIDWSFPVTVEDVVMMGRVGQIGLFRWPRRNDWRLVAQSLDRVNASHLAKKQIGDLSGGQQQRVFIARALAQEAELLLMDEPLAGLDVPSRDTIFDILDKLRPDGVTVLMATHDLNLATDCFDKVILLNQRVVAYGPPAEALHAENLMLAYGGHMHILSDGPETMVVADTCCDHSSELPLERNR